MEVVDQSLEVSGKMGPVFFQSRFGRLRLELVDALPHALLIACAGRLIESVVDHAALRGRGWRIIAVQDAELPDLGQSLVVATGSLEYSLPWR